MKIKINTEKDAQGISESFEFNVLSEHDGIRLWLVSYNKMNGRKRIGRWAHFGDNGTFIKRDKIAIPDSVKEQAIAQVSKAIYVD